MPYLSKKYINEYYSKNRRVLENVKVNDSISSFKQDEMYDVFLSYSYNDKEYAIKIYKMMKQAGYSVYIDIGDSKLDRDDVDEETAMRIANIMNHSRSLIYVHTPSAKVSKWCPWELGYMSGRTGFRCAIIPLIEDKEDFPHQEYLGIYPVVDYEINRITKKYDFWVNKYKTNKYISLNGFINGNNPCEHKE